MNDNKLGSILVLVAAASLGTLGVLGKIAYGEGLTIATVLALRFTIGSAAFFSILGITETWKRATCTRRDSIQPLAILRGRKLYIAIALGTLGYGVMSGLFFWGLRYMSPGMVAITFYTYPIFVILISSAVLREKITKYTVIALLLAFCGVTLITGLDRANADPRGMMIVLASALIFAAYVTVSRAVLAEVDARVLTAHVLPSAAFTFIIYGSLTSQLSFPSTINGWIAGILLGVVATAIPVFAFLAGLSRIRATHASILMTFEPVVAVLLACALLGDPISWVTVVGGSLVLAATVLIHRA
jgi:drug/metabolite transporter (DMT)-like permease